MSNQDRDPKLDNFKGILIILVILGHTLLGMSHTRWGIVSSIIYMFHMPAFVFISGYLTSRAKSAASAAIELFSLYAICQIAWFCYLFVLQLFGEPRPSMAILALIFSGWGLWYLISLAVWRMLTPLFSLVKTPLLALALMAANGAIIGLIDQVGPVYSLSRIIVFAPFFAAGFWSNRQDMHIFDIAWRKEDWYAVGCVVLLSPFVFLVMRHFDIRVMLFDQSFSSVGLNPKLGILYRFAYYVVAISVIRLLYLVIPARKSWLTAIGCVSLSLYIGHPYIIKPLERFITEDRVIWLSPLLTALCVIIFMRYPIGVYFEKIRKIIMTRFFTI